jgi:hypothetical protein
MGYSMTAFCLFTWDKWLKVVKTCKAEGGGGVTKTSSSKGQPTPHIYFSGFCLPAGVQIHLFPWTCLLLEPTIHIALYPQSNGAKKRKVKKEGMISVFPW